MCIPTAVGIGIATGLTGAVGSISSYSQAQAQAEAQNQQLEQQYLLQRQVYDQQERAYQQQIQLNARAASRAYVGEQQKIQAEYKRAALEADNMLRASMRAEGAIRASGRSGQSIGILAMDPGREYGRDLATLGLNLGYAKADYMTSIDNIFDQATTANNQAASSRGIKPAKPQKVSGPSPLGLIGGLAGAGLSGYDAYRSQLPPVVPKPA